MLTQAQVRYWFDYNPATGVLTWRVRASRNVFAGQRAGGEAYAGMPLKLQRRQVRINRVGYNEANVIWLWMTGVWPSHEIDHVDNNPVNNVWSNLRLATSSNNQANKPGRRSNRLKWAYVTPQGKYQAQVRIDYTLHCLGTYDTEQEAHNAAYIFARSKRGAFARR